MEEPPLGKAISAAEESNDLCAFTSGSSLFLFGGMAVELLTKSDNGVNFQGVHSINHFFSSGT